MAKKGQVDVKVRVDVRKPVKNITELNQKISDMRAELEGSDFGSARFDELANSIREAEEQVKELDLAMEALDPAQKAEAFLKMGEGMAGGFMIAQGAMGVLGAESEKFQQIQTKVQSAIAIAMGVRMVSEAAMRMGQVKRMIVEAASSKSGILHKTVTLASAAANWILVGSLTAGTVGAKLMTVAMRTLRAAIIATGIGALVLGVIEMVQWLISWLGGTEDVNEAQTESTSINSDLNNVLREQLDTKRKLALAESENEKELIKLNYQLQQAQKETDAYASKLDEYAKKQAKASYELNESIKTNNAHLQQLRDAEKLLRKKIYAVEDDMTAEKKAEEQREKNHKAWQKRQDEKLKNEQALEKLLEDIELLRIDSDYERGVREREMQYEKDIAMANEIIQEELKEKTLKAIREKYWEIEKREYRKHKKNLDKIEEDKKKRSEKFVEDEYKAYSDAYHSDYVKNKIAIQNKFKALREEAEATGNLAYLSRLNRSELKLLDDLFAEHQQNISDLNDAKQDEEDEKRQYRIDAEVQTQEAVFEAISLWSEAYIGDLDAQMQREIEMTGATGRKKEIIEEKYQKKKDKAIMVQKHISAAQATIDTYKAATGAYAAMSGIPVVGPVIAPLAAAAIIAAGLANVKMIYAQDVGGGTGGGGTPGGAQPPVSQVPASTGAFSLLPPPSQQKPMKAYVVTDDLTTSQEQLEDIRQQSTI